MSLPMVLKWVSPLFVLIGSVHLVLGSQGELLLGAILSAESMIDPVLDSQNRFYGVAFTSYGFLLFLSASDLPRYALVVKVLLAVFFAAGCARIVSIILVGLPPTLVLVLLAAELILPPITWFYLDQHLTKLGNSNES